MKADLKGFSLIFSVIDDTARLSFMSRKKEKRPSSKSRTAVQNAHIRRTRNSTWLRTGTVAASNADVGWLKYLPLLLRSPNALTSVMNGSPSFVEPVKEIEDLSDQRRDDTIAKTEISRLVVNRPKHNHALCPCFVPDFRCREAPFTMQSAYSPKFLERKVTRQPKRSVGRLCSGNRCSRQHW